VFIKIALEIHMMASGRMENKRDMVFIRGLGVKNMMAIGQEEKCMAEVIYFL
jgi:hypothetical protein